MLEISGFARLTNKNTGRPMLARWEVGKIKLMHEGEVDYILHKVHQEAERESAPLKFNGPALLLLESIIDETTKIA